MLKELPAIQDSMRLGAQMSARARLGDDASQSLKCTESLCGDHKGHDQYAAAQTMVDFHRQSVTCMRSPLALLPSEEGEKRQTTNARAVGAKKQCVDTNSPPESEPRNTPVKTCVRLPPHPDTEWFQGGHVAVLVNEMRKVVRATGMINETTQYAHERMLNVGKLAFAAMTIMEVRCSHDGSHPFSRRLYSLALSCGGFALGSLHTNPEANRVAYYHYTQNLLKRPNCTTSIPAPSLLEARLGHVMVRTPHGVLACGGNANVNSERALASCEILKVPSTDRLLSRLVGASSAGSHNEESSAHSWARLPAKMLQGRLGAAAACAAAMDASGDSVVTVTGGAVSVCGARIELTSTCEQLVLDAKGGIRKEWREVPPLSCPRMLHGAAHSKGILYAVGGVTSKQQVLNTVEALLPQANKWMYLPELPFPLKQPVVMACESGGIFVCGGIGVDGVPNRTTMRLALASARWEVL